MDNNLLPIINDNEIIDVNTLNINSDVKFLDANEARSNYDDTINSWDIFNESSLSMLNYYHNAKLFRESVLKDDTILKLYTDSCFNVKKYKSLSK